MHEVGIFIKIDTGYHRTGVVWNNFNLIDAIFTIIKISPKLKFKGFLTHNGNTYTASSIEDIANIFNNSNKKLLMLKSRYINEFSNIIISVGDTPSCSIMNYFNGIDEIRPGNFVFYDVMQYYLGSCTPEQIAVSVACPVVSKNTERSELVIYGGAVHLSKDSITDKSNNRIFGPVAESSDKGWEALIPGTKIISLTQEHGIVSTNKMFYKNIHIGDTVHVLPIHSCLAANNFREYFLTTGERISNMER